MSLFRHFFALIVLPLLIFSVGFSYYRFILEKDYLVGYDAACNPETESCYVRCEDDACEEPEYYASAERYASALYDLCGYDISGCEVASTCTPEEKYCSITYCDKETEECAEVLSPATLNETDAPEEGTAPVSSEEDVDMAGQQATTSQPI
jgi:hypothetical protein